MSIVWPLLCCWYHTKLVEFVELGDYAYANSYQKWTCFYLSFSIVGSCLFPAILIQICCSCVWFYPMCSYVQNTVGANITQICLRSIFGKEHLQICGGKPKCKVILPKQDTHLWINLGQDAQKQIAILSFLCWPARSSFIKHKHKHH